MRSYHRRCFKYETNREIESDMNDFWASYYYYELHIQDEYVDYEYLDHENTNEISKLYRRRGIIGFQNEYLDTRKIDMESFYSKDILRDRKIEQILSDIKDMSNTIENIISHKTTT